MSNENHKKAFIITFLCILIVAALNVAAFSMFFNKKEKVDLIDLSNKFFTEHMEKMLSEPSKKDLHSYYNVTGTKIVAGDLNEFVAEVDCDLTITESNSSELTHLRWTMRVKKDGLEKYNVINEGPDVSTRGLKVLDASSKAASNSDSGSLLSLNTSNKYSLKDNLVSVTYDNGDHFTIVPIPFQKLVSKDQFENIEKSKDASLEDGSYYITPEITAFVYSGEDSPVKVTITKDQGKTWNTFEIPDTQSQYGYGRKFVGFTSLEQGYVVLAGADVLGHQQNNIYETNDGGKSWKEIGNTNYTYAKPVTGAGFVNDKILLIGFRYENDNNLTIYRTTNSGNTWKKVFIQLPSQYHNDYATPLCPIFKGAAGILPVKLKDANKTVQFRSNDYGETWVFDKDIEYNNQIK